ncbi:hypothetical protein FRB99_006325 [Tulasnella sp. 403]|nr:hypothetical protein FRB99_006325 [Tulasnella sp. 403]
MRHVQSAESLYTKLTEHGLQVLSGCDPFYDLREPGQIYKAVIEDHQCPLRDPIASPTGKLYSYLWDVAKNCWLHKQDQRPPMDHVLCWLSFRVAPHSHMFGLRQGLSMLSLSTAWPNILETVHTSQSMEDLHLSSKDLDAPIGTSPQLSATLSSLDVASIRAGTKLPSPRPLPWSRSPNQSPQILARHHMSGLRIHSPDRMPKQGKLVLPPEDLEATHVPVHHQPTGSNIIKEAPIGNIVILDPLVPPASLGPSSKASTNPFPIGVVIPDPPKLGDRVISPSSPGSAATLKAKNYALS